MVACCSGSCQPRVPADEELHIRIIRAATAFRRHPHDILRRILDVAGLAVHAVLRIDLQALGAVVVLHELVHAGGTVARFRTRVRGQVDVDGHAGVLQRQVDGLVFRVVRVRDEDGGHLVEGQLAVRFRVHDLLRLGGRFQAFVVAVRVVQGPRRLATEDDLVDARHQAAQVQAL